MALSKILFVTNHFPPDIGAASNRSKHVVEALRGRGLYVDVLTSRPVYPNPALYRGRDVPKTGQPGPNGRTVYLMAMPWGYRLSSLFFRLVNQFIFWWLASCYILFKGREYRTVVTSSPPFIVSFVGLFYKWLYRGKWVLEVRDLWPDSLRAVGKMSEGQLLFRLLRRMERLFYEKSDGIVLLSPGMEGHLARRGIAAKKYVTLTNGIPTWMLKGKKKSRVHRPLMVRYIGNLGYAQDFTPLLEVAKRNPGIRVEFIGEGMCKKALQQAVRQQSLDNVRIRDGIVSKERLLETYLETDIGYIGLKRHELFSCVIPSKLFEYGAVGVPILYAGPEASDCVSIIQTYRLGDIVTNPEEVTETWLKRLVHWYETHARRVDFVNQYSWDTIGDAYCRFLTDGEERNG